MNSLRFKWDTRKASANRRKHGVSFDEAKTVFLDEEALLIPDEEHSNEEDRSSFWVLVPVSEHSLFVIATDNRTK